MAEMNDIRRFDPLDEVTLDNSNFVASLFGAAYEKELISDKEVERFQGRLLELLSYVTFKYTKGESSSVMEDIAKRMADSSLYLLGLSLRTLESRGEALGKLLGGNLPAIYEDGIVIANKLLSDCKKQYNSIVKAFVTCGNEALSASLKATVRIYLQKYPQKVKFFAHELPTIIEYDLYHPIENCVGIEYINEYLLRLSIENSFLKLFGGDELLSLFKAFDSEYKDALFNLFEVVLKNAICAVLIGLPAGKLKIGDEYREKLADTLASLDEDDIYNAVSEMLCELECDNNVIKAYILADMDKLVGSIKRTGAVFVRNDEEINEIRIKIAPKLDNVEFSLLLEELEESGNKAGFLRNEFHSLSDVFDVLSGGYLTDMEIYEYFDLLPVMELTSLFCFCKQTELDPIFEDYLDSRGDIRAINVRKYSHYIKFI